MKKTLSFIGLIGIALIVGFSITACGGGNSPSSVVRQLHTAIEKNDTKKIDDLMVPEAVPLMLMFAEKAKGTIDEQGKIIKTEETINGDTAIVKVIYENEEPSEFHLVKVDGKWKVTMEK